jgi:hypothetical protein
VASILMIMLMIMIDSLSTCSLQFLQINPIMQL